jgi:hypothetical protein
MSLLVLFCHIHLNIGLSPTRVACTYFLFLAKNTLVKKERMKKKRRRRRRKKEMTRNKKNKNKIKHNQTKQEYKKKKSPNGYKKKSLTSYDHLWPYKQQPTAKAYW